MLTKGPTASHSATLIACYAVAHFLREPLSDLFSVIAHFTSYPCCMLITSLPLPSHPPHTLLTEYSGIQIKAQTRVRVEGGVLGQSWPPPQIPTHPLFACSSPIPTYLPLTSWEHSAVHHGISSGQETTLLLLSTSLLAGM